MLRVKKNLHASFSSHMVVSMNGGIKNGWSMMENPIQMDDWLVVGPPLWKIWKSIGMIIPNIWENRKCSKPPTRWIFLPWTPFSFLLSWGDTNGPSGQILCRVFSNLICLCPKFYGNTIGNTSFQDYWRNLTMAICAINPNAIIIIKCCIYIYTPNYNLHFHIIITHPASTDSTDSIPQVFPKSSPRDRSVPRACSIAA